MKKEPPDVIIIDIKRPESPLYKWINLMEWAKRNKNEYLYQRAKERIINMTL